MFDSQLTITRNAYWDYVTTVLTPEMEENSKHFWKFIKDSTEIAALRSVVLGALFGAPSGGGLGY